MPRFKTSDDDFDSDEELASDACQEEDEDDDAILDEPCEGDLVTEDHISFYTIGGSYRWPIKLQRRDVTVDADEDWQDVVRASMDKQQFWPNVWFVSDHGNWHALTLGDVP
jgi:hypothetical protein